MNEQLVLTLIAIVIGGSLVMGGRKLVKSSSEGARRLKLVVLGIIVLVVGAFAIEAFGPSGAVVTAVILGITIWVTKGFKQK